MTAPRAQDPAEGSRDIVNRELARATTPPKAPPATATEIKKVLRRLDGAQLSAILALEPTIHELEEAAAWLDGDGDRLAHPLEGKAAAIFDILDREQDLDDRD